MDPEIQTGSTDAGIRRHDYQSQASQTSQTSATSPTSSMPGVGKALRMREELSTLKSDLDALMSHASTLSETELREARDRILARFSSMRFAARGMAEQATRQFSQGRDITADYVRDKPLQSVAIAAGIGLLIGAMLRRD